MPVKSTDKASGFVHKVPSGRAKGRQVGRLAVGAKRLFLNKFENIVYLAYNIFSNLVKVQFQGALFGRWASC